MCFFEVFCFSWVIKCFVMKIIFWAGLLLAVMFLVGCYMELVEILEEMVGLVFVYFDGDWKVIES